MLKRDIHCTLFLGDQIYNKINDLWISLRLKRKKKKEKRKKKRSRNMFVHE